MDHLDNVLDGVTDAHFGLGWFPLDDTDKTGNVVVGGPEDNEERHIHLSQFPDFVESALHPILKENAPTQLESFNTGRIRQYINEIRQQPYEKVDLGHSSERDNGFGFAMRHDEL